MTNKYMNLRIVWLLPGWGFSNANGLKYWEPIFTGCQRAFRSVIFITTGVIHSYYAEMFSVHSVGQFHWKKLYSYKSGYGARGCALLSPAIVPKLLKLKPQLIISTGFNFWTILAAFFKKIGHWKLVVLWDGSSPTIDATDDPIRLLVRKWIAKHTDAFITNSMGGTHYFQDSLHVSKERVFRRSYLIADVKNLTNNPVTSLNIQEGQRPRFLCVGKLISRKGIYELLNAWSKLEDLSPERPTVSLFLCLPLCL